MNKDLREKIEHNKDKILSGVIIVFIGIGIIALKINTDNKKVASTANITATKQEDAKNTQKEKPYAKEISIIEDNTSKTFKGKSYSISINDDDGDGKYEVSISLDANDNRFNEAIWCGINGLGEIDGIKKYNPELDDKISVYNLAFYSDASKKYSAIVDNSSKTDVAEIKLTSATGEDKIITRQDIATYQENEAKGKAKEEFTQTDKDNIPQTVTSSYKAKFGKVLEANKLGKTLTIKFKIEPSSSNKLTIDKNGFNVEDLILNQGGDQFDTINYWAVSDMTDGTESKVISFTVNKDLIQLVKNKSVFGQQIVDKAKDVWILPSLKS